ncbi:MAG: glycosyltransferase [Bacteroidetes bacterium]|nr:glycosyltransferase [Bacteroidota bacterium]
MFTIVSCAKVRNIKRIHLIPEILEHLDIDLKWIHIGNENLKSKDTSIPVYEANKEKLKGKKNIVTEYKGAISNKDVLDFYKENTINLYISVSETEGLPVSMMEVISFGIPILATNVGGCDEIVTNKAGVLIPKDFDSAKVANQIKEFRLSEMNDSNFRDGVRSFLEGKL